MEIIGSLQKGKAITGRMNVLTQAHTHANKSILDTITTETLNNTLQSVAVESEEEIAALVKTNYKVFHVKMKIDNTVSSESGLGGSIVITPTTGETTYKQFYIFNKAEKYTVGGLSGAGSSEYVQLKLSDTGIFKRTVTVNSDVDETVSFTDWESAVAPEEDFIVTLNTDDGKTVISCDKIYSEIKAAYDEGKTVKLLFNGAGEYFDLLRVQYDAIYFSRVLNGQNVVVRIGTQLGDLSIINYNFAEKEDTVQIWQSNTYYEAGTIVNYCIDNDLYLYKCVTAHTSGTYFEMADNWIILLSFNARKAMYATFDKDGNMITDTYVNKNNVDTAPTKDSENLITSGGVYNAIGHWEKICQLEATTEEVEEIAITAEEYSLMKKCTALRMTVKMAPNANGNAGAAYFHAYGENGKDVSCRLGTTTNTTNTTCDFLVEYMGNNNWSHQAHYCQDSAQSSTIYANPQKNILEIGQYIERISFKLNDSEKFFPIGCVAHLWGYIVE